MEQEKQLFEYRYNRTEYQEVLAQAAMKSQRKRGLAASITSSMTLLLASRLVAEVARA
jgi:hypothetical protein